MCTVQFCVKKNKTKLYLETQRCLPKTEEGLEVRQHNASSGYLLGGDYKMRVEVIPPKDDGSQLTLCTYVLFEFCKKE